MTLDISLNLLALALSGAMAALLGGVLFWFASPSSHAHYRHWAWAWMAQAAYYVIGAVSFSLGVLAPLGPAPRFLLSSATQVASVLGAALLVVGAVGYVKRRVFSPGQLQQIVLISLVLGVIVAAVSSLPEWRATRQIFRGAISAASFIACGWIVRRHQTSTDRPGRLLGSSLIGFGLMHLHYVGYAVASAAGARPAYSLGQLTIVDVVFITAIVTAMITLAFADQQDELTEVLRQREREFRELLEHSSDLVLILDESLVLRYASPSTARMLGWPDAVVGESLELRVHPDDLAMLVSRMAHAPGASDGTFLLRLRHRDGNWVRVDAVASVATTNTPAAALRLIINARDLSERERLEATLRESQKLESVGRLAGGLAHDLNNILTVIGGNAELGLIDAPESVREPLAVIAHATTRAADMTRQLLTFARRHVVANKRMDAWDAVRSTTRMAARLLPESIELRVRTPSDRHTVCADPGQLEQVVMNLLVNARDAIAASGVIEVEVGNATLITPPQPDVRPGQYVTISVRDTGAGIPEFVRPHLFEPFFTTKGVGEGTGLGLATSYGIVRQAGGFIHVESEVGVGSTFRVFLPVCHDEPTADNGEGPAVTSGNQEHILVVEDEVAVRDVLVATLRRAGYRVSAATNGAEALALFDTPSDARDPVDAIVTDVVMPRVGGMQLLRTLRDRRIEVPVVLVSGHPGDVDFLRSLPPRAVFLQKPLQGGELTGTLRRLLHDAGAVTP